MEIDSLGKKIRDVCKEKNVRLSTMLDDLGLGKNYLIHLNQGTSPTIDKLAKIANYLDVSVDYLIGNEIHPSQRKSQLEYFSSLSDSQLDKAYRIMREVFA